MGRVHRVFETALDCGLFHTFDVGERLDYAASLAAVTSPGAHLFGHCGADVTSSVEVVGRGAYDMLITP